MIFKSFFDGYAQYKLRSVYEYDDRTLVAEYYLANEGYYLFGFGNFFGFDDYLYLYYTSVRTRDKLSKREIYNEVFDNVEQSIGYVSEFRDRY